MNGAPINPAADRPRRVFFKRWGFKVSTYPIGSAADPFMDRWIVQFPTGHGIHLHRIHRSDNGRDLHDHPFWFCSLILTGGYTEHLARFAANGSIAEVRVLHHPRLSLVRRKATDAHRLELDRPAWTVLLAGPKVRDWNFISPDGTRSPGRYIPTPPRSP